MAAGELAMWIPTSATLQQLERAESFEQIRDRLAPGALVDPRLDVISPEVTRIVMPAGGGVPGQPIASYLVGRTRLVLVDPGDPIGPGLDLAIATAAARGGAIEAIALTQVAPDHAGGAEASPRCSAGSRSSPVPGPICIAPICRGARVGGHGPCPWRRPDPGAPHARARARAPRVPSWATSVVIAGDLDGRAGARSILGPVADAVATAASSDRLRAIAPGATWLTSHPGPDPA